MNREAAEAWHKWLVLNGVSANVAAEHATRVLLSPPPPSDATKTATIEAVEAAAKRVENGNYDLRGMSDLTEIVKETVRQAADFVRLGMKA